MSQIVAILGPTASGKSALAHELALKTKGVILSCDSAQIYRGFDIGTAKPSQKERKEVPYFGIDFVSAYESYDAGKYVEYAHDVIAQNSNRPIYIVGGTGLYFRALTGEGWDDLPSDANVRAGFKDRGIENLYSELCEKDPERAEQIHPNDRFRIERALEVIMLTGKKVSELYAEEKSRSNKPLTIVLDPPRDVLRERIELRTQKMLQDGLVEEVKNLRKSGILRDAWPMQMIGYDSVNRCLDGEVTLEKLPEEIVQETTRYAKRQRTWFSRVKADLVIAARKAPDMAILQRWIGL